MTGDYINITLYMFAFTMMIAMSYAVDTTVSNTKRGLQKRKRQSKMDGFDWNYVPFAAFKLAPVEG